MTYKGYNGIVSFDDEAGLFHGEVSDLRDVITFQGRSVDELRNAFQESVDDYLAFCEERGEQADKAFSGKFVLRVDPQLHRQLAALSLQDGTSLNSWVSSRLHSVVASEIETLRP